MQPVPARDNRKSGSSDPKIKTVEKVSSALPRNEERNDTWRRFGIPDDLMAATSHRNFGSGEILQ
jgi:hypothetical protein